MFVIVMNALLELLDDEDDADELPDDEPELDAPEVVEPVLVETPLPETVWPTTPFTAVTTPSAGACNVVHPMVWAAVIACSWAWASDACAAVRSLGCSCRFAAFVAIVALSALLADVSWFCACVTACASLFKPLVCAFCACVNAVWSCEICVADAFAA